MIIPQPLKKGDRVALIAPASCAKEKELINAEKSVRLLELEPVFYPSCCSAHGYFAGDDSTRLKDLHDAFSDTTIKGIFCLRGGYGCGRLLPHIDFDMIRRNPKLFVGYSDVCVLHIAFNQICDLMTIHGTMPSKNWTKVDEATVNALKNCVFGFPEGEVLNPPEEQLSCLVPGAAQGRITGGNLTLLLSTLGSPYEIDTRGKILYIEDIGEKPYSIDRMLTALSLSGKFRDAAGIILGPFVDCEETDGSSALTIDEIIDEIIVPWGKPTIKNFRSGHVYPHISFPMGAMTKINSEACTISMHNL